MKLYDKSGNEVIVYYISGDIFWATITKKVTVTYNNGSDQYIQELKKDEAFSINDIGKRLFFDYKDTPFASYEEERRIQLELQAELKKQNLNNLDRIFNKNYLHSKRFWENNIKDSIDEDEFNELLVQFVLKWFEKQNWKSPDYEQAQCIANTFDDILVVARAGSGKTSTIINRASFLVKHCDVSPSEILILAFNKEAAKEVNKRLEDLVGEYRPHAMTFHALAYAIVHPEEELIFDDVESGFSKGKTVQQVIDSFLKDSKWYSRIKRFMLKYFRAEWEEIELGGYFLSPDDMVKYRKSIPYIGLDGKYYKSKVEKRIADFLFENDMPYSYEKTIFWNGTNYKPDFTIPSNNSTYKGIVIEYFGIKEDKSYDEQTFQKREYWNGKSDYIYIELFPDDNVTSEFLYDTINVHSKKCGLELKKLSSYEIWLRIKERAIDEFSRLISQFIGRCRKGLITPDDLKSIIYKQGNSLPDLHNEFISIVSNIYMEYLNTLETNNEEDFDGLLIRADEAVKKGQTVWNRKSGSGDLRHIKYLFIDEYQDFSLLFYRLIDSIREKNTELKLFCVGDDWQAINGFAGSDLKFFKGFNDYFKNATQLTIASNYRSYKKIIDVSNQLMKDEGVPSRSICSEVGEVYKVYLNEFVPNDMENSYYKGDIITPALIRIINNFIMKGQKVALLTRRRNSISFYNGYSAAEKRFHKEFLFKIRQAFPEKQRFMIVDMNTAHSYKGKEEETIIVVDALNNSYPLIHPSSIFFNIIGSTIDSIISEEKRLFYVALSRAKKSLVIITEQGRESPFILNMQIDKININNFDMPKKDITYYIIKVCNNSFNTKGTFVIKSDLRANNYRWDPIKKSWYKHYETKNFSIEKFLDEPWIKKGDKIFILVTDEFNNNIHRIDIENGIPYMMY